MSTQNDSEEFVRALARGLSVIQSFDAEHAQLTLSDVAKRTDMTRATARRLLHTLQQLDYVASDGKYFSLRPKVLSLGFAYLSSLNLAQIAQPYMEQLVDAVQESCSMSVLDGSEVVYVARVPTKRIMSIGINIGTRLPAANTSMGRVLLSDLDRARLDDFFANTTLNPHTAKTITDRKQLETELERIRAQGWALVDQELEEGLRSVAAPIKGRNGKVIAAINLSGHATRITAERLVDEFVPPLLRTAAAISESLRHGQSSLNQPF